MRTNFLLKLGLTLAVTLALRTSSFGQGAADGEFKLAFAEHKGQLKWSAPAFKAAQFSAKNNDKEIGVRGKNESSGVAFLGFLFLVPDQVPLTGTKCRDGAVGAEKKSNSTLKILSLSEITRPSGLPVSIVSYSTSGVEGKTTYMVRGLVASEDICGDLEFYSNSTISPEDPVLKNVFASYQLDDNYTPKFTDALFYAQTLYSSQMYREAAPAFERAIVKLREHPEGDLKTMTRVLTDQAGMSYGIAGDIPKARAIFEKAIAQDPDYPLYYYNLACADAQVNNLKDAQTHLRQAFERRANTIPGESMPDPTKDDSFLPYRSDKQFWTFLEGLPHGS